WTLSNPFSSGQGVLATSVPQQASAGSLRLLQVQPLLAEAVAPWQWAGIDTSSLGNIQIQIADLGGTTLGSASRRTIWLDANAAGWGWFVEPKPWDDSEFPTPGDKSEQGQRDLWTVLRHEIGYFLSQDHEAGGLIAQTLTAGTRQVPASSSVLMDVAVLDWVFA